MNETPDIVYGRLLESAHISGYGFERMCDELEWLYDEDRWRKVGPGYNDINAFLATIDLSPFDMVQKKRLAKKHAELKAKQEASAKALGVAQSSISNWTGTRRANITDDKQGQLLSDDEQSDQAESQDEAHGSITDDKPAESFQRSPEDVVKASRQASRKDKAAAETKAKREASRNADPLPDGMDLRHGDAREALDDVPTESVALVLTDPPYGDDAEPLYDWLAKWSARVLVPGGSLICYTGQSRLDRDMRILGEHLRYWWQLAMMHDQSQRLPGKFVIAGYKPVLWYVKDHRRGRTLVPDVLKPPARDKELHNWAQGEGGVSALIEHLADPGDTIADPFAGTATWGRIAAQMGRRWIGATLAEDDGGGVVRA